MRLLCIGINHKTADLALREKLAFDQAQTKRALKSLAQSWPKAEFVIVSTCNRTEIYTSRFVHGHPRESELRDWLGETKKLSTTEFENSLYTLSDAQAAEHLFEVAAGMDSLVPGEAEIAAQVKAAYALAAQAWTAKSVLNELFQTAFHVAKHIRTETKIGQGKVSVASVAIDHVLDCFKSIEGKCVLNVGAGKMNKLMLKHLIELGAGKIIVANRSIQKARTLAAECYGTAATIKSVPKHLKQADIVLASTAAARPIISHGMVKTAQESRKFRPMLIVDIAVPRDVDERVGNIKNISLYNIDDLEKVVAKTVKTRKDQKAAAGKIITEHVDELMSSLNIRDVGPVIEALYNSMRKIADDELASALKKLSSHPDCQEDAEIIKRTLHRMVRKIVHPATRNLRKQTGEASRADIAAIRRLFDLDELL